MIESLAANQMITNDKNNNIPKQQATHLSKCQLIK